MHSALDDSKTGTNKQKAWMRFALSLAFESKFPTYKMACVAVKGGHPVGYGFNRASPGILKNKDYSNASIHCELDLEWDSLDGELKGSIVYVAGVTVIGNLVKSKPCEKCQKLLYEMGVKTVFYHEQDGSISKWKPSSLRDNTKRIA